MIELPPLRQRREDLPWLVSAVLAELDPGLACDAQVIEACVLRQWPGNVRELITELRVAGQNARQAGRNRVTLADLAADAGMALARPPDQEPVALRQASARPATLASAGQRRQLEAREVALEARRGDIEAALRDSQGNVSVAARQLGIHRTQLRRWLTQLAIDPAQYAGGSA
jgi:DNA-binding NtrC family response regulator